MHRREMLLAGGAAVAAQLVGSAVAGCGAQPSTGGTTPAAVTDDALAAWAQAANGCLLAGDRCQAHCLRL
ncbi:MAG: hypothetical protein IT378_14795, partial [Sandaracinaceae bacterium]|nr:hypothetical protein [Sandaracinaceae bacterium]